MHTVCVPLVSSAIVYPKSGCGVGAGGYIGYFAATDACYILVFSSICSSEMSICSSLVALGQVWYLIVSIPDPCCLSYFDGSVLQSTTDEDCLFLNVHFFSFFYYKVGVISCKEGCPKFCLQIVFPILLVLPCLLVKAFYDTLRCCLCFGMLEYSNYSPYTC